MTKGLKCKTIFSLFRHAQLPKHTSSTLTQDFNENSNSNSKKFKSVYCISCKVFTISNFTINQILSIRTYYTNNTQIVNKVTNYIMLGVFIWDGCMLFNYAHRDVHTQHVQYIQDQCTIYNKKKKKKRNFYIGWLVLSDLHLTISL